MQFLYAIISFTLFAKHSNTHPHTCSIHIFETNHKPIRRKLASNDEMKRQYSETISVAVFAQL